MRSIDPFLLSKINQQNQTIYNNANPKVSVQVSRAKTTVSDSTYWTVETIRERPGLGDLSLAARRQKAYGPPNRIYNIYVENNVVRTAIREYPDYLKEKWKDQFNLGSGTAVAIAFNGEWEWYRKKWQLKTYENPFIFWVDGEGKLWSQLWDDASTLFELASGVSKVKAIRGWKNVNFANQDHGVVAGYIKAGKVYYRGWCTQVDGTTIWETEKQLIEFTGTAVNLNLFITNDYRMGFVIEDSLGNITLYITTRNWAGMAIQPHTITAAAGGVKVDFIAIEYIKGFAEETITGAPSELEVGLLYADTNNKFIAINAPKTMIIENEEEYEDWGWIINLTIDHPIPSLALSNITVTNLENNTGVQIASIEKVNEEVYRLHVSNVVESGLNNIYGNIQIDIIGTINQAGYAYINMMHTFTPINLVPTFMPLPEVEVIWNE